MSNNNNNNDDKIPLTSGITFENPGWFTYIATPHGDSDTILDTMIKNIKAEQQNRTVSPPSWLKPSNFASITNDMRAYGVTVDDLLSKEEKEPRKNAKCQDCDFDTTKTKQPMEYAMHWHAMATDFKHRSFVYEPTKELIDVVGGGLAPFLVYGKCSSFDCYTSGLFKAWDLKSAMEMVPPHRCPKLCIECFRRDGTHVCGNFEMKIYKQLLSETIETYTLLTNHCAPFSYSQDRYLVYDTDEPAK